METRRLYVGVMEKFGSKASLGFGNCSGTLLTFRSLACDVVCHCLLSSSSCRIKIGHRTDSRFARSH